MAQLLSNRAAVISYGLLIGWQVPPAIDQFTAGSWWWDVCASGLLRHRNLQATRLFCQHPVSPDLAGLPNLGDLPHLVLSFYLVVGGLLWMVGYCGWWVTVDGPSLPPTLLLKKELSCWCRAPCCLYDVTQAWCNVCEILAWNWPTDCLPGLQSRWCEKTPYNFPDCSILYKKNFRVVSLQTMI